MTGPSGGLTNCKRRQAAASNEMSVNATGKKTPLQKLRKAWKRADPSERAEFLLWLRDSGALEGEYASEQDATVPVSSGRYLRPDAVRRIREVMTSRRLNPGDVMGELGFDPRTRPCIAP